MGLFGGSKGKREIEELEEQAAKNPSPLTLATLAEKYVAGGQLDKALDVSRKAVKMFPDSERVVSTHQNIVRTNLQKQIVQLQHEMNTHPSPLGFARLATIYYKDMGDRTQALETCRLGLATFPDNEDLNLINGQVRYDRFHEDYLAKDGLKAIEHLETAVNLNSVSYKGLLLLSRLYIEIGMYDKAAECLESILKFAPDDERVRTVLPKVKALPTKPNMDRDELFSIIERAGGIPAEARQLASFYEPEPMGKQPVRHAVDKMTLQSFMSVFETMPGYQAALVTDYAGAILAANVASGPKAETLAEVVTTIHTTCEDVSRRMDIGSFSKGAIEGPAGFIHMIEMRDKLLSVFCTAHAKIEMTRATMEKYLDSIAGGKAPS